MKFIPMKVSGVAVDPDNYSPLVLLKDMEEKNTLPIWIGIMEAAAILAELEKIEITRPMTHDLTKNILCGLDSEILNIKVTELKDNIFYAAIFIRNASGSIVEIDSRPSDAIALAMRFGAPILVSEEVITGAGKAELTPEALRGRSGQELADLLRNMANEDFGKYKM